MENDKWKMTNGKLLVSRFFCLYDLPCHSLDSAVYEEKGAQAVVHAVVYAAASRRACGFLG